MPCGVFRLTLVYFGVFRCDFDGRGDFDNLIKLIISIQ